MRNRSGSILAFVAVSVLTLSTGAASGTLQDGPLHGNVLSILFHSDPNPPRAGQNKFEVLVKNGDEAVKDAEVSLTLASPRAQEHDAQSTKNIVLLKHYGDGIYRGQGQVARPGQWAATIRVTRAGREIGTRTQTLEVR